MSDSALAQPTAKAKDSAFQTSRRLYTAQFLALSRKCWQQFWNNPGLLLTIFLYPIAFVLLLEGLRSFEQYPEELQPFPPVNTTTPLVSTKLPKCQSFDLFYRRFDRLESLSPCVELVWGVSATASAAYKTLVQGAMAKLTEWNTGAGFSEVSDTFNADTFMTKPRQVLALDAANVATSASGNGEAASSEALFRLSYRNQGKYDTMIWFWEDSSGSTGAITPKRRYQLWVNGTASEIYERHGDYFHYSKVQGAVENALLSAAGGSGGADDPLVDLSSTKLPILHDTNNVEISGTNWNLNGPSSFPYFDRTGVLILMLGLILSCTTVMQVVVREKTQVGLRTGSI